MAKRYNEAVAVYRPKDSSPFFIWRGKRYDVLQIANFWVSSSGWWRGKEAKDQQFFKVVAKRSREETTGTYELCYDNIGKTWRLVRVLD